MFSSSNKHSLADTFTPGYLSLVKDYLSANENVIVNIAVLGKTYSGHLGVIQRVRRFIPQEGKFQYM